MTPLPPELAARVASGRFDLLRAEAHALGISDSTLRRWRIAGHLDSVAPGVYVVRSAGGPSDTFERVRETHLRRGRALVRTLPGAYLVGRSAAVGWGLPLLAHPNRLELSRATRVRTARGDLLSRMPWGIGASASDPGLQDPAECVVEVAAMAGVEAGLVAGDALLHQGVQAQRVVEAVERFGQRKGSGAARVVSELIDGRVESPGESRVRWACLQGGIELVPQVEIRGGAGEFVARVDFLVNDSRVVVEFDGLGKYAQHTDLRAEKMRQLALERLGYTVVRFAWKDLADPAAVVRLVTQAVRAAARGGMAA